MSENSEVLVEISRAEKTLLAARSLFESDFYEDSQKFIDRMKKYLGI